MITLLVLASALSARAAVPPNDTCAGSELVPTAGPFPYLTAITDLKDATSPGDPGPPACFPTVNRGIWYRFTPPTTALYTISCSGDTATTVPDTVMALYSSANGCAGPFTEIACNDDEGDLQSAISRTLNNSVTYYILVWVSGLSAPLGNLTTVQLRITQPTQPTNDQCAGAEIIPGEGPFPYLTATNDTTLATTTGDPPAPLCNNQSGRSVWFRFTPALTATYELSLCTNTATTVYDPMIGVYTGTCGGPFSRADCSDNTSLCGGSNADLNFRPVLTLRLTNGVTYSIVAWEAGSDPYIPGETQLQLRVSRFLPPTVLTLAAHSLTSTGAVLSAQVNPNASATVAWFQYGLTTNYGAATAPTNLGAVSNLLTLMSGVSNLAPGLEHHYRAVATNALGLSWGSNLTFQWSSAPPHIGAIEATHSQCTLRATGQTAQLYAVESSTNLLQWLSLGLADELGGGQFQFSVPNEKPVQFFRFVAP